MFLLLAPLVFLFPSGYVTATATEGILLSGGLPPAADSAEIFVPATGLSCSLPSLPDWRSSHTMNSLNICGGYPSYTTCLTFSSGQWNTSHTLLNNRDGHLSWQTDQGLVLMGGYKSTTTSEIVPIATGQQGGPAFSLEYSTVDGCAIQDLTSDSVIITGGQSTTGGEVSHVVSRYDLQGHVEDLPQLLAGRYSHGCGSYLRQDGTQVLLVAGGYANPWVTHYSTELLTKDSTAWIETSPLPFAASNMRGVTIGNVLTFTGGYDGSARRDIIEWNDEEEVWVKVGNMKIGRSDHAVTTINLDDMAMDYCV